MSRLLTIVDVVGLIIATILLVGAFFGDAPFEDRVIALLTAIVLILLCKDKRE
jgi:hypothetical protein